MLTLFAQTDIILSASTQLLVTHLGLCVFASAIVNLFL